MPMPRDTDYIITLIDAEPYVFTGPRMDQAAWYNEWFHDFSD